MDDRFRRRIVWAFGISTVVNTLLIAVLFWLVLDLRADVSRRAASYYPPIGIGTRGTPDVQDLQRQIDKLKSCQRDPRFGC